MEISQIAARFAEGLIAVDAQTQHISANPRTGEVYQPGVKTMSEPKFVEELVAWWEKNYYTDFPTANAIATEVPYRNLPRAKCDLVLSTDGSPIESPEWSIEVKNIALVGNNGKNNDFGVAKILSPYLKDRSLIHDILRLKEFGIGRRKAVVGYCFDYSFDSCEEALMHHMNQGEYINNIHEVCRRNDPVGGTYSVVPMIEFADEIFQSKGLVNPVSLTKFSGAWRHPCGGNGYIFSWELI
jgi:hypothetical protein